MTKWLLWPLAGLATAAFGIGSGLSACSKEEPPAASPTRAGSAEIFRFAPPDRTEYVRTERRSEELDLAGAPLHEVDSRELRWRTRIEASGDRYRVTQELVYVAVARDGEILAQGTVPEGLSVTLWLDRQGNVTDVQGLERTAETLRSLVAPATEAELEELVGPPYRLLFGDLVGRPAAPGSRWTIASPTGSLVESRTVTVAGREACGEATCARLEIEFELDPKEVTDAAARRVRSSLGAAFEDPSKVSVEDVRYTMSGSVLLEPATMLSHGAALREAGTVTVVGPERRTITMRFQSTTDLSYSYDDGRLSRAL
jgi:hypothetical protein